MGENKNIPTGVIDFSILEIKINPEEIDGKKYVKLDDAQALFAMMLQSGQYWQGNCKAMTKLLKYELSKEVNWTRTAPEHDIEYVDQHRALSISHEPKLEAVRMSLVEKK